MTIKYDPNTGEIIQNLKVKGTSTFLNASEKHLALMNGQANPQTQYIKDGEIVDRPKMSFTTEQSGQTVTFSHLPRGATIRAFGQTIEETDGTASIELPGKGEFPLSVQAFPYQKERVLFDVKDDLKEKLDAIKSRARGGPIRELIELLEERLK